MIDIDGSLYSGSGSVVRQAVVYAGLTGRPVRIRNARARRPNPGLRPQHVRVVEAVRDLVGGTLEGVTVGSHTLVFSPGRLVPEGRYAWDVGTAGSATALALAVLPLLACRGRDVELEIRGGLFQDFAPSVFHLQHVLLPLVGRVGVHAGLELVRPGYTPIGDGIIRLIVPPAPHRLHPVSLDQPGDVRSLWGISLSSHLEHRQVSARMANAAGDVLAAEGFDAEIEQRNDLTAAQPGAAFALFADLTHGVRLGADGAGAPHRRAEHIGATVARQLLQEIASGATTDRFTADQILPFAALASGDSIFRVLSVTDHVTTGLWLASMFLGAGTRVTHDRIVVHGSTAQIPR